MKPSPEDLDLMRESVCAYAEHRKARDLPPSDFFADKVRAGLVQLGVKVRRPAPPPEEPR